MRYLTTMRHLWIPLVLAACSAQGLTDSPATRSASASPSLASSSAVVHSFTGSGVQNIVPGFSYGFSGAIHSDGNGGTWGTLKATINDLSLFGLSGTGAIEGTATCLRVVGNEAWANLVVTKTDQDWAPVGSRMVMWIKDGGPGLPDVGHLGPAWSFDVDNKICSETPPPMPSDPVTSGNFVVR